MHACVCPEYACVRPCVYVSMCARLCVHARSFRLEVLCVCGAGAPWRSSTSFVVSVQLVGDLDGLVATIADRGQSCASWHQTIVSSNPRRACIAHVALAAEDTTGAVAVTSFHALRSLLWWCFVRARCTWLK
jgi:hypothetical protein